MLKLLLPRIDIFHLKKIFFVLTGISFFLYFGLVEEGEIFRKASLYQDNIENFSRVLLYFLTTLLLVNLIQIIFEVNNVYFLYFNTLTVHLLFNAFAQSQVIETVIAMLYIVALFYFSIYIADKLFKKISLQDIVLFFFILNFLYVYFYFQIPGLIKHSSILFFVLSLPILISRKINRIRKRLLFAYLSKSEQRYFFFYFFVLNALATVCIMLLYQPIVEWDSGVSHIPMVKYFIAEHTLSPDYFIIQSYFINFSQISSMPFFSLLGMTGLKFYNLLLYSLMAMVSFNLSKVFSGKFYILNLLSALAFLSAPSILSMVGNFQYDLILVIFSVVFLTYFVMIIKGRELSGELFVKLSIVFSLGLLTKLNFISLVIPLFLLGLFYIYRKRKFPYLPVLIVTGVICLIIAKSFLYSDELLFPYLFVKAKAGYIWDEFGVSDKSLIWRWFYFPIGVNYNENYGTFYKYTFGIVFIFAYLFLPLFVVSREFKVRILLAGVIILPLLANIYETQYSRYSLALIFLFVIFIFRSGKRHGDDLFSKMINLTFGIMLFLVILLQLSLLPGVNWWIKLNGNSLVNSNYSDAVQNEREIYRIYPEEKELLDVTKSYNRRSILISNRVVDYNYINRNFNRNLIYNTWQMQLEKLFEKRSNAEIFSQISNSNIHYIIFELDGLELYQRGYSFFEETKLKFGTPIYKSNKFTVYKVSK